MALRSRGLFARALLHLATLKSRRAQGRPGADIAPAVRCAKCTRREDRTAAYRWCRTLGLPCAMVGRLMPCSPGSRTFPLASLASRNSPDMAPVGAKPPPQDLTVATTARTTRFCRTQTAPLVCTRVSGSQGLPALPAPSRADAAASTASPARDQDDDEIAPPGEPGWTTHTPKPNFGKVEYFCCDGLTERDHRQGRLARMERGAIRESARYRTSAPDYALAPSGYKSAHATKRAVQSTALLMQSNRAASKMIARYDA